MERNNKPEFDGYVNLLVPEGTIEKEGINKSLNLGSFSEKLVNIMSLESGLLVTEVSDEDYLILKPVLDKGGIKYKIVINVPGVPTPPGFIFEPDSGLMITFEELSLRDKTDTEKMLDELEDRVVKHHDVLSGDGE